MKLFIDLV